MPDRLVVGDLEEMTRRRLVIAATDALLPELARLLAHTPVSLVVVCTPAQTMAGIVTKTDVLRQIADSPGALAWLRAADAMTREVIHCRPGDPLEQVLGVMRQNGLVHMPVVDSQARPVGVMEARDALRALAERSSEQTSLLRDYITGAGYR